MDSLDRWLQTYDFGERHERMLPADAKRAFGALLATPAGCNALTRALLSVRRLPRRAFGRYWRMIGPFSALIRRRWLAAAAGLLA